MPKLNPDHNIKNQGQRKSPKNNNQNNNDENACQCRGYVDGAPRGPKDPRP